MEALIFPITAIIYIIKYFKRKKWYLYESGSNIGHKGPGEGVIIYDEEYDKSAHITLEKGGIQPFEITCGIYDAMVHTAFASTDNEAKRKYSSMKKDIEKLLKWLSTHEYSSEPIQQFVKKY